MFSKSSGQIIIALQQSAMAAVAAALIEKSVTETSSASDQPTEANTQSMEAVTVETNDDEQHVTEYGEEKAIQHFSDNVADKRHDGNSDLDSSEGDNTADQVITVETKPLPPQVESNATTDQD